jgi:non-canonical purine NTP pyrophosphatase (RdgB/HAM1 family)
MVFTYKMNACFRKFNKPVLVDDTSFHLSSLNGFPGPYIKDFLTAFKSWQIGQRFDGDRVKIVCRIGICFGANDFVFGMGELDGTITGSSLRNDLGTEFDLIVTPDGKDKLMIDYSTEEKNQFSHRGKAVQDVLQKLKEREEKIALKA